MAAFDDAIYSLHPPHDEDEIDETITALKTAAAALADKATTLGIAKDFCTRWRDKMS